ncbi:MAG: TatD family hydrolase [Pseudoflavonifractor sp.]|nr:TatD family hydrolase [Alloprevotella sp.]MCM1116021.1 TatD family hydrolase [Pseudoflavonifractor sp.]
MSEYSVDGDSPRAAVDRAQAAGVETLVMPNVDLTTIAPLQELASSCPGAVKMAMGLHPTEVNETWAEAVDTIEAELRGSHAAEYVAVGEVGIDLYWDKCYRHEQMEAFDRQARLAAELRLPLIIHCRDGLDETLEVIEGLPTPPPAMVMHCFGGTEADVEEIRHRASGVPEIFFGIGGVVTFTKSTLPDVLPAIELDHIVLETDSPYLAPTPHRGKRNESALLPLVAAKIGAVMFPELPTDEAMARVDAITTANARRLFPRLNDTAR